MQTRTILHLRLKVNEVTHFHSIPKIVCTRTHISRHPIYLTNSDYDYTLEEFGRREKLSLKEMWDFIVTTNKIDMSISNEYCMYLLYIYIITVIRYFIYVLLQHKFDVFEYEYVCNVI